MVALEGLIALISRASAFDSALLSAPSQTRETQFGAVQFYGISRDNGLLALNAL